MVLVAAAQYVQYNFKIAYMKKMIKNVRGFTLIELILTTMIISIGLFGVLVIFGSSISGVISGDANIVATYLAQEKMEQLISDKVNYGYAYMNNSNYTTTEDISYGGYTFTRSFNMYQVQPGNLTTAQSNSGYTRINLTISWGGGSTEHLDISTLVASY